jgi:hypothetical protein
VEENYEQNLRGRIKKLLLKQRRKLPLDSDGAFA